MGWKERRAKGQNLGLQACCCSVSQNFDPDDGYGQLEPFFLLYKVHFCTAETKGPKMEFPRFRCHGSFRKQIRFSQRPKSPSCYWLCFVRSDLVGERVIYDRLPHLSYRCTGLRVCRVTAVVVPGPFIIIAVANLMMVLQEILHLPPSPQRQKQYSPCQSLVGYSGNISRCPAQSSYLQPFQLFCNLLIPCK